MMFLLFIIGVLSVFTQVFILREVYLVFSGNELSTGILLSSWMVWIGAGVVFARRYGSLILYSILYTIIFPLSLFLVYSTKGMFHLGPGEVSGLPIVFFVSFVILAPLFFLLGCIFGRGMREWESGDTIRGFIRPYMLDSIGDLVGGLLFSYVVFVFIKPYFRPVFSSFIALTIPVIILKKKRAFLIFLLLIPLVFLSNITFRAGIERTIPHGKTVQIMDTVYDRYTLVRDDKLLTVYVNGEYNFTYPDRFKYERVHIPFVYREKRKYRILSLGFPSIGEAVELLKEGNLTIVQPDRNLPFKDLYPPGVKWVFDDPLRFVLECKEEFDFVFLRTGLPYNLSSARFFTEEFGKRVARIVDRRGIFVVEVPSSENYLEGVIGELNNAVFSTFRKSFKFYDVVPGESAMFLFSKTPLKPILERMDSLPLTYNLGFITSFYLHYLLEGERHTYAAQKIRGGIVSTMRRPVIFFSFMNLWAEKYSPRFRIFLRWVSKLNPLYLFILLLFPLLFKRLGYAVSLIGGLGIGVQLLSIFTFQMVSGGAYIHIGLLVGIFMLGLGMGSYLFERIPMERFSPYLFLFFLPLYTIQYAIYSLPPDLSPLLFLVNLAGGVIIGYTYGSATCGRGGERRTSAASVYFYDLIGGAIGSLLISLVLIPINGISPTIYILVGLSLAGFLRFII